MINKLKIEQICKIKKPFIPFFSAILIFLLVNLIKKIMKISLFNEDMFYKLFSFAKTLDLNQYIPYSFFIKFSFFSTILYVLLLVFFIFIYAAIVQFFLHFIIKNPARFSKNLNVFYYYSSILYFLTLMPIFGSFFWFLAFLGFLSYGISMVNFISKLKAFFIILLPFFSFISIFLALVFYFLLAF